jgi:RNA polymerase sigma-70 factor (ECF subfamily)
MAIVRDPSLAADVTQQAYVSAYSARERFRGDSPGHAWLHRIVVNESLAAIRKRRKVVREITPAEGGARDDTSGSVDRLALNDALDRLAPRPRAAVVLRYYLDYDYATIAQILGTFVPTVRWRLHQARRRLARQLNQAGRIER